MAYKMKDQRFDLIVIGSGPAGQKGAICAAKLRKRVAVIDRTVMMGGVCVHTGTIPSKSVREAIFQSGVVDMPTETPYDRPEWRRKLRGSGFMSEDIKAGHADERPSAVPACTLCDSSPNLTSTLQIGRPDFVGSQHLIFVARAFSRCR